MHLKPLIAASFLIFSLSFFLKLPLSQDLQNLWLFLSLISDFFFSASVLTIDAS